MNTQSFKRFMPLFAFFLMLAAAEAGDTVTTRLWRMEYPYGTSFQSVQFSKTDKFIVALDEENFVFLNAETGKELGKIANRLNTEQNYRWGIVSFINNDKEFLIQSVH